MEVWKFEKLKGIKDEVRDLHPLLKAIFKNDKTISRYEYTHGQNEMGADFVIARIDQTLGDENYVGVIAKCGNIKQDYSDIKKQIDECSVERYFDGGRKKIYLNEIWIICNGSISNGAERKIHEEYKSRNIKFIDIDKLYKLVESNYPYYWNEIPTNLGIYLQEIVIETVKAESYNNLGMQASNIDLTQELHEVECTKPQSKLTRFKKPIKRTIDQATDQIKFLIVEGGMGSGKTTLFRRHVRNLCQPNIFQQRKILPKILHFSEIADNPETKIEAIIESLSQLFIEIKGLKLLLIIDGIDEVHCTTENLLIKHIATISKITDKYNYLTIILGSRPVWTIEEGEIIQRYAMRFSISQLSIDQIYKIIQHNCTSYAISEKLRRDLSTSSLIRAIPRTPMIAILLAKVLNAKSKEIPQTLPELYSKYVELALGRWDIDKGLMTEREYPIIITVLSLVAKYMLENGLVEVAINEIIQIFETYIKTREGLPTASSILQKLIERSEIVFINKERNTFLFRHKSFAEYLFALHQKESYGQNAPFINPFEGYWLGVEYFYLGLIQDAGCRIDNLSNLDLIRERDKILRLLNFGNLMLAAYQTEYAHIENAIYTLVIEMTRYFIDVRSARIKSELSLLPELQFFALISTLLRRNFQYPYFRKALEHAQLQCQCDLTISEEERNITSFFIDAVRVGLTEENSFEFLTKVKLEDLPWVVKLCLQHLVEDEGINFIHIKKLTKKIGKTLNNNQPLKKYIRGLYSGSMIETERKLIGN